MFLSQAFLIHCETPMTLSLHAATVPVFQQMLGGLSDVLAKAAAHAAAELMEHARLLALPPTRLSPEERAELEDALAASRRGEFASEADVNAMYHRHGL